MNKNHSFLSLWQQDLTEARSSFEYPHKFPLNFTAELMRRNWKWHLEVSTCHETLQFTVWSSGVFSEVIIAARMRQMIPCDGLQPPPTHTISPQHAHYPHHTRPHHHDHRGAPGPIRGQDEGHLTNRRRALSEVAKYQAEPELANNSETQTSAVILPNYFQLIIELKSYQIIKKIK